MKKNKGLKITIIILAILIILSVIAFALIYVFTDLFKSNKELFAKYAVSMMQEKTAFLPSNLKEYINKKSTTPYENNGILTANILIFCSSLLLAASTFPEKFILALFAKLNMLFICSLEFEDIFAVKLPLFS